MTAALSPLQETSHAVSCAVVMVDHHNRVGAATTGAQDGGLEPDPIVNVLGSTAKGAMADCIMGMYRQAGGTRSATGGPGHDVEEFRLNLTQDGLTHCWQVEDATNAAPMTTARTDILAALEGLGLATSEEVARATGRDPGNVHRQLQDLVNVGFVVTRGKNYALATGGGAQDA